MQLIVSVEILKIDVITDHIKYKVTYNDGNYATAWYPNGLASFEKYKSNLLYLGQIKNHMSKGRV